jgi:hypothetical protein
MSLHCAYRLPEEAFPNRLHVSRSNQLIHEKEALILQAEIERISDTIFDHSMTEA